MSDAGDSGYVTELIELARAGDRPALGQLVTVLHDQLRDVARARRAAWRGNDTMSTTVLINEAYLRLTGRESSDWENRAHFLAVASRAMRQILIDYSRRRRAQKRGGEWDHVTIDRVAELLPGLSDQAMQQAEALIRLDECLAQMEVESPRHCRIVECRFFGGMTIEETALALDVSTATVKRGWAAARAWLLSEIGSP